MSSLAFLTRETVGCIAVFLGLGTPLTVCSQSCRDVFEQNFGHKDQLALMDQVNIRGSYGRLEKTLEYVCCGMIEWHTDSATVQTYVNILHAMKIIPRVNIHMIRAIQDWICRFPPAEWDCDAITASMASLGDCCWIDLPMNYGFDQFSDFCEYMENGFPRTGVRGGNLLVVLVCMAGWGYFEKRNVLWSWDSPYESLYPEAEADRDAELEPTGADVDDVVQIADSP